LVAGRLALETGPVGTSMGRRSPAVSLALGGVLQFRVYVTTIDGACLSSWQSWAHVSPSLAHVIPDGPRSPQSAGP
jgi:hypothetical protein